MARLLPTVKATQFVFPHCRGEDMPCLRSGSLRLERAKNGCVFAEMGLLNLRLHVWLSSSSVLAPESRNLHHQNVLGFPQGLQKLHALVRHRDFPTVRECCGGHPPQ
jgi:hypothetical protein